MIRTLSIIIMIVGSLQISAAERLRLEVREVVIPGVTPDNLPKEIDFFTGSSSSEGKGMSSQEAETFWKRVILLEKAEVFLVPRMLLNRGAVTEVRNVFKVPVPSGSKKSSTDPYFSEIVLEEKEIGTVMKAKWNGTGDEGPGAFLFDVSYTRRHYSEGQTTSPVFTNKQISTAVQLNKQTQPCTIIHLFSPGDEKLGIEPFLMIYLLIVK